MNKESEGKRTAFGVSKEEFFEKIEEERNTSFEDKALDKFVKDPKEEELQKKMKTSIDFLLLSILFAVIFFASIISAFKGEIEPYVAIPIAFLAIIGIGVLIGNTQK